MSKVLLVGNPNSGKTTLYNRLTGKRERIGNWHGVTVCEVSSPSLENKEIIISDLPGVYSIKPFSPEEHATTEALKGEYDVIINVIEAVNLTKSLYLTRELIALGRPVIVVITKLPELVRLGGSVNVKALEEYLGCMVFLNEVSATLAIKKAKRGKISANDVLPKGVYVQPKKSAWTRVDAVLLHPLLGGIVFFSIMLSIFYLTFGKYGLGVICGGFFEKFVNECAVPIIEKTISYLDASPFLHAFIVDGIVGGVSGVACFLPQLAVIYLCLIVLEQSGYLARVACLFDGVLKRVGLSGSSIFPLLVGFGCTATAILSARSAENDNVRKRTILALFFLPCSARIPVFVFLCSAFFMNAFVVAIILYAVGLLLSIGISAFCFKAEGGKVQPLIFELPSIQAPKIKEALKQLNYYLKTFIIKVATVLLVVSMALWLLRSFSLEMEYLTPERIEESILARVGRAIGFMFLPIGDGGWRIPVAVLCGLVAKEGMVSAFALCYPLGISSSIGVQTAIALMTFSAFYTPCTMALASARSETNTRLSVFYGLLAFLIALICSYISYGIAVLITTRGFLGIAIAVFIACIVVIFIIVIIKKSFTKCGGRKNDKFFSKTTWEGCKACGRAGCPVSCGEKAFATKGYKGERKTHKRGFNV